MNTKQPNNPYQAGPGERASFVIVRDAAAPSARLADGTTGELMHPLGCPQEEVNALYVEQIGLVDLIANADAPLVIWDVGLGMATNAMAVVRTVAATDTSSPTSSFQTTLISFDLSPEPLVLALANFQNFPHLMCSKGLTHPAPLALCADHEWSNDKLVWRFVGGDFTKSFIEAPKPDLIIFDPFSAVTNPAMWSFELLSGISNVVEGRAAIFVTYSASTALRAALLACGWWVARGRGFGRKGETTIAVTSKGIKRWPRYGNLDLFGEDWLQRWTRSSRPWPQDVEGAYRSEENKRGGEPQWAYDRGERSGKAEILSARLRSHPQFMPDRLVSQEKTRDDTAR